MTQVDQNRLIGHFGASYVASRLSATCLVRPVIADTDVGVDLYCESVTGETPFLHFWIQVKAGRQCRVGQDGSASCPFNARHLRYWERQPVPVFAALVPVEWPVRRQPQVYIANLTRFLVTTNLGDRTSVTIKSDHKWPAGNAASVERFVREDVPNAIAMRQCREGVVGSVPTPEPQYEVHYPTVPVARFGKRILGQIRTTAACSILFLHESNALGGRNARIRRQLATVVRQFENDPHWENFMAIGLSLHADGKHSLAIPWYEKARRAIQGDPKVADLPNWKKTVRLITKQITKAQREESV